MATTCPYCAEEIVDGIPQCVHCGSDLDAAPSPLPSERGDLGGRLDRVRHLSFFIAFVGFVLQLSARRLFGSATGVFVGLLGTVLFFAGLGLYARSKGRSFGWGLLGLLSCIGFLLAYFLDKNCHSCKRSEPHDAARCSECGSPL